MTVSLTPTRSNAAAPFEQQLVAEAEAKARDYGARLRALEAHTGVTLDPDAGAYWLARVCCLERLAAAVGAGSWHGIAEALAALDAVPTPVCRMGDHEARLP